MRTIGELQDRIQGMNRDLPLSCFGDHVWEMFWIPGSKEWTILSRNLSLTLNQLSKCRGRMEEWDED